jgi:hypothetical protein
MVTSTVQGTTATAGSAGAHSTALVSTADLDHVCFYITPIGDEGSEQRKHADLILGQIVEPAIESLGFELTVIRADHLTQPGMISQQILQNVLGARLVIGDLSYHNPNVFYELAIRHATGLPTVLISRASDRVPFDIADLRVVRLDMTDLQELSGGTVAQPRLVRDRGADTLCPQSIRPSATRTTTPRLSRSIASTRANSSTRGARGPWNFATMVCRSACSSPYTEHGRSLRNRSTSAARTSRWCSALANFVIAPSTGSRLIGITARMLS